MERELIIRMAREVDAITGLIGRWIFLDAAHLERFAALVAAHEREKHNSPSWETVDDAIAAEREACAKVAESIVTKQSKHINDGKPFYDHMYWEDIAAAIRAREENA